MLKENLHFESIFVNSQYVSIQVKVLETAIWEKGGMEESVIPVETVEEEQEEEVESVIPFESYTFSFFTLFESKKKVTGYLL